MEECDTLLLVGTNFPYTKYLPFDRDVRSVQIDTSATRIGSRLPIEVPVIGDAKESLAALTRLLTKKTDRSFLEKYQKEMDRWRDRMLALEDPHREPVAPQYLMASIDD